MLVGAYLLFQNLGDRWLWTDEAEAACLARSILDEGLPKAFDGKNYITQWIVAKREDYNDDLVWVLSPWMQLYICAGSFWVFGVTTLAARLPFALFGLGVFWMLYRAALHLTADRRIARISILLLSTCIPFLLHSRQARYYPVSMFATLWALCAYCGALDRKRWSGLQLALAVSLLFHSNYGLCVPLCGALALHATAYAWGRARLSTVVGSVLGIVALTLPWALYADIHRTASRLDLSPYFFNLLHYLHVINRYGLPLILVGVFLVLRPFGWRCKHLRIAHPGVTAAILIPVFGVLFVSTNVGLFTRYTINVFPLFVLTSALLIAWLSAGLAQRFGAFAERLGLLLVPLTMFTGVLPMAAQNGIIKLVRDSSGQQGYMNQASVKHPLVTSLSFRHEFFDFWHEIHNEFKGPLRGICEFLQRNTTPDQTVFIDYGDLPVLFYVDATIRGGLQGIPYDGKPEWIIHRANRAGTFVNRLDQFCTSNRYVPIVLPDYPDTRWQNRPDPLIHFYRTPEIGPTLLAMRGIYPPVTIYKRPDVPLLDESGAQIGVRNRR